MRGGQSQNARFYTDFQDFRFFSPLFLRQNSAEKMLFGRHKVAWLLGFRHHREKKLFSGCPFSTTIYFAMPGFRELLIRKRTSNLFSILRSTEIAIFLKKGRLQRQKRSFARLCEMRGKNLDLQGLAEQIPAAFSLFFALFRPNFQSKRRCTKFVATTNCDVYPYVWTQRFLDPSKMDTSCSPP